MKKILFLSYDGILEPLGYSQILSYLIPLSKKYQIYIFSFEKRKDLKNKNYHEFIKEILLKNNISHKFFSYQKNYFKYFIILYVLIFLIFFIKINKINKIHARSYIPALIAYVVKFFIGIKIIFDMRGFWIEERLEWKIWKKNSLLNLIFKFLEKKIINKSESIVTLTNVASDIIKNNYLVRGSIKPNFEVIPTASNLKKKYKKNKLIYNTNSIILTHLGSIGTRYDFDKYLRIGNILNKNYDVFYSIINKDDHAIIKEKIQNAYIKKENYNLKYVLPYEIDKSIYVSSFGVFFPVNGFYLNGYFPTKLGEFLSNGIPVITCPINKDVDSIIRNNKIGIIIDNTEMNNNNILREIENILLIDNLSDKCRAVAEKFFNIENAIKIYQRIYNK